MKPASWIILAIALLAPGVAFAQITHICDIIDIVNAAATWFGIFVFIVAVMAVLYAAFLYLTSAGNEETIKKAHTVLVYALIGIAVALLATSAAKIVQKTVGGTITTTCPR
ncbi:MAG: hypothetical protein A3A44_00400 [Candidatus Sungbacteria bacterium RIFCSPLOWO2_01_FULL_60_25]|uniref:Uncharacterized protein n=1 Tax=Candidatus Sungbacteria bacterium RIFCSPLOWO2_01_FULL_60_25 TaxID=1802281 RepID=A0A1G2LH17_9BACT|nr:MAG: hypothetical protein A3A44_00400 [Candidatus Sungbacteria bacterium RIFCSPLOWO2_01_FULL_60_25]